MAYRRPHKQDSKWIETSLGQNQKRSLSTSNVTKKVTSNEKLKEDSDVSVASKSCDSI